MTRAARRFGASVGLALLVTACSAPTREPHSAILISIDTLRADHLGCYGHERATSPTLDALAAEGVLFEQAVATSPWTLPSHVSLLTGRYASRHGVHSVDHVLDPTIPTLGTVLSEAGVATAAIVNSLLLDERSGLARGFAHFEVVATDQSAEGAAPGITQRALAWLEENGDRPYFLFVHYFDVHSDYRSLPRYEALFPSHDTEWDGSTDQLMASVAGLRPIDAAGLEHLRRLYDAGIRQLDGEIAHLVDGLRDSGRLDATLLVVTSDHGEEFHDHGDLLHGRSQYEEQLRVPLIVRGPRVPAGARVSAPVSATDVAPTLLAALGRSVPEAMDGRDLAPLWGAAPVDSPRAIYAEAAPGMRADTLVAVREGHDKLIVDTLTGETLLFDIATDPGEREDLSARRPERVRELRQRLEAFRDGRARPRSAPRLDPEQAEQLRQLGYH